MTQTLVRAPLQTTLERVTALSDYINVELGEPEGDDWFSPGAIFAMSSPHLEGMRERMRAYHKTDNTAFLKVSVFANYLWMPVVTGIACYLAARRVPDLSAANMRVHINAQGWVDPIALLTPRFVCLPDGPAVSDPDATVVPDEAALRAYYAHTLFDGHLKSALNVFRARLKLGKATMEKTLADRVTDTVIWLSKELCQDQDAPTLRETICRDMEGFLEAIKLTGKSGVLEVEHAGRRQLFLKRQSCYLSYKLPEHGYCASCPLQSEEECVRRFQAYLASGEE